MTTETIVTTQAELDAAVASGAERIIIDSPEGVWLEVTGRVDVVRAHSQVNVRGSGSVGRVTGSGRVGEVTGSGRVDWVTGSGSVGRVTDSGRVGEVTGSGRVDWVTGSGSVGEVTGSGSVGEVTGSGSVDWVTGSGSVDWVTGSGSVGRVTGSGSVGEVTGSGRVGEVTGSGSVGRVTGSGSVGEVTGSGSVDWVTGSGSVGRVTGSGRVGRVTGSGRVGAASATSTIHLYGGTLTQAAPHVAVFVHTADSTWSGGTLIDLRELDLTDVAVWREFVGADWAVSPDNPVLVIPHVSSQDDPGRLDRDGTITIGCFEGSPVKLREVIEGDDWPSGCDAATREAHRPRILEFAGLCQQQILAWDTRAVAS